MRLEVDIRKQVRGERRSFPLDVAFAADSARIVLYGPSGAGKSLTLQMIAGLIRPDAGRIVVDGETWFDRTRGIDRPPRARSIGYVFQDYALFPHRSVAANIAAALEPRLGRRLDAAGQARLDALLARFALRDVAASYPAQLSGGQRQRTALARALACAPRRLLLDEPFAALDGMLRARVRDDLIALQRDQGVPWLLITHDPDDVARCAEMVVRMEEGRVVAVTPDAGAAAPRRAPVPA